MCFSTKKKFNAQYDPVPHQRENGYTALITPRSSVADPYPSLFDLWIRDPD